MMQLTKQQLEDFEALYRYLRVESILPDSADAIVVGGSGSHIDMADRAAELNLGGLAPIIVCSGFAHLDHGVNEARLLSARMMELGVARENILEEPHATNTGLNIVLSAKILDEQGLPSSKVILVHKPHMTRRFLATAEAQWPSPQPTFYVTSADYTFVDYLKMSQDQEAGEMLLGRILHDYLANQVNFGLGYSSEQLVDREVQAAYGRLLASGSVPTGIKPELATDQFGR